MEKPKKLEDVGLKVGDYVLLKSQVGVVYKVDEVNVDEKWAHATEYVLRPVYGAFGAADKRGIRRERPAEIEKIDLVRAGVEHMKMQEFVKNVARHESGTDE